MILTVNDSVPYTIQAEKIQETIKQLPPATYFDEYGNTKIQVDTGTKWTAVCSVLMTTETSIKSFIKSLRTATKITISSDSGMIAVNSSIVLVTEASFVNEYEPVYGVTGNEYSWKFELEEATPADRYEPITTGTGSIIEVELVSEIRKFYIPAYQFSETLKEKSYRYEYADNSSEEEVEAYLALVQIDFGALSTGEFIKAILKERTSATADIKIKISGSDFFGSAKSVRCLDDLKYEHHFDRNLWHYESVLHFITKLPVTVTYDAAKLINVP